MPPSQNVWEHHTATPAQVLAGISFELAGPKRFSRLKVIDIRSQEPIYIGLDRADGQTGPAIGSYDLLHPGNGQLDESVPPAKKVTLKAASAPANNVDVWLLGGAYAERTS